MTYVRCPNYAYRVRRKINMEPYRQDIHGSWDIKFNTGVLPHTAIPEVNSAVNTMLKAGVKIGKINLGIG
jgi:hypothetical protein